MFPILLLVKHSALSLDIYLHISRGQLSIDGFCLAHFVAEAVLDAVVLVKKILLRKKGSKMKERMKEEGIAEKGDCGPPTQKVFFCDFVGLEPSGT